MSTTNHAEMDVLQIHELNSSASDSELMSIMALYSQVFKDVPSDTSRNSSLAFWRQRLLEPGANILFVSGSKHPREPLGFFFNFAKTQEKVGFEALHIWLAGVSGEARGLGIFPMLMERTKEHARALRYEYMTVATIPSRFHKMFRILQAHEWELVEWRERSAGRAVLMKLKL